MEYEHWLSALSRRTVEKTGAGPAPQDVSLPVLESLLSEGYAQVLWTAGESADEKCLVLDRQTWGLAEFISGLSHAAPIFEHSHVGCRCTIIIEGEGLSPVVMNYQGVIA